MVLALLLVPNAVSVQAESIIHVWTDENTYVPGDNVEVQGYTNVTETVTIKITNSSGHEIHSTTDDPDENGDFSMKYLLDVNTTEGTYGVNATVSNIYNTTSYVVEVEIEVEDKDDEPDEANEASTSEGLLCAIDRAFWFIEKVNSTANTLDKEGYDVTHFWNTLTELNRSLTELRHKITEEDMPIEEASKIFSGIRGGLGRLQGLLRSCAKKVKEDKAQRYMEHMENLINSTMERIERFNKTEKGGKLGAALEAQKRRLWRLRLQLNVTNLENTVDKLEDISEDIDGNLTEYDSEGFSMKAMYKVLAKIQVYNATVERMKKRGKHMNNLEQKLGNAKQIMEQMKKHLGVHGTDYVNKLIEEAEENFKGVGKTIRQLNKPGARTRKLEKDEPSWSKGGE
jgi:uncharacterized protein (UPF0335 family)